MDDFNKISSKFDYLYSLFGVKEEINTIDLLDNIIDRNYKKAATVIARKLGLPISVSIQLIKNNGENIRGGKVAEVSIPGNLPLYGSKDLYDFPILIRLFNFASSNPDIFVNIISHELSHILLASIKSPFNKDEKMVDLCPILLGFREVIQRSRVLITYSNIKTSYGYLNDNEFYFAYHKTSSFIELFRKKKSNIADQISKLSKEIALCKKILQKQELTLKLFDKNINRKIKNKHISDILDLHDPNYFSNKSYAIDAMLTKITHKKEDLEKINHYGEKTEKILIEFQDFVDRTKFDIKQRVAKNRSNSVMISKYLNIFEKINLVGNKKKHEL